MADEVTSGFTTIEEDNVSVDDAEKHLKIEITDFLGDGSNLRSYLNLGAWAPVAAAATTAAGKLAEPVFNTEGQPDPSAGFTRDESGDDMLAPFLYNPFLDDTRDRSEGADAQVGNVAFPSVNFSAHAKPPGLDDVLDPSHVTHGGDNPFYMEPELRAAVTRAIPKFVGWRDHTEGHRITTTRGDKIEVVGGNSKLFVLGRGSGTVNTDWSGGHVVNNMEAPGLVTSVNWRKVPTGDDADELGWQWVEETVKGNVIKRFHGTYKTEHYGDEIIEIIGRADESAPDGATNLEDVGDFEENVRIEAEENNRWDAGRPSARSKPRVIEQAFLTSGFVEERVDGNHIDIDHAKVIDDYRGCMPVFDANGDVKTVGGDVVLAPGQRADVVREQLYATHHADVSRARIVREEFNADRFEGRYEAPSQTGAGLMKVRETWTGAFGEMFVGANTQLFVGPNTTFGIALRLEAFLGVEAHVKVGLQLEGKLVHQDFSFTKKTTTISKAEAAANRVRAVLAVVRTSGTELNAGLSRTDLAAFRNIGA